MTGTGKASDSAHWALGNDSDSPQLCIADGEVSSKAGQAAPSFLTFTDIEKEERNSILGTI